MKQFSSLFAVLLLTFAAAQSLNSARPASTSSASWQANAVFYEVFVRSFQDSNGDGIGDFNGLTSRLDDLKDLGVTALWLMPIFPSPSYHGYDVTDYDAVNPQYGTMQDFEKLLEAAHEREMKVILAAIEKIPEAQDVPLIIAGDFNEGDSHDLCAWLRKEMGMCDALALYRGFTHWWPVKVFGSSLALVLRNRLDHVFYLPTQLRVSRVRVIDNEGIASDHLPVICDFQLAPHDQEHDVPSLPLLAYTGPALGWRKLAPGSIWTTDK